MRASRACLELSLILTTARDEIRYKDLDLPASPFELTDDVYLSKVDE